MVYSLEDPTLYSHPSHSPEGSTVNQPCLDIGMFKDRVRQLAEDYDKRRRTDHDICQYRVLERRQQDNGKHFLEYRGRIYNVVSFEFSAR
jgi:hypothetical protein